MAIAAWKRLEKTPGYQRKKLFFKRLVGREPRLRPDVTINAARHGGWWFHPDVLDERSVVYSLGVGEDLDFDLALVGHFGCELHAFDRREFPVGRLAQPVGQISCLPGLTDISGK